MAAVTNTVPIECESHWVLPLNGRKVIQLRLDFAFGMEFGDSASEFSLRIYTTFAIENVNGTVTCDPERLSECGPALRILHSEVVHARAFKNGHLKLDFTNGSTLSVAPNLEYEAWEGVGMNGARFVSMPGGELAVWSKM